MMDPLTLATDIAGLLGVTIQVSQIASSYIASVKSASKAATELSTALTVLSSALTRLDAFLCTKRQFIRIHFGALLCDWRLQDEA